MGFIIKIFSGAASGTRNFTSVNTGKNGPTQSNCNTAYASTDLNGEVSVSNGIPCG